ncbi:MAG TPA: flagellar basal body P-ring formation chaperone FlgA [Candidatus Kapabacteria bacterium]|nr:flagellar basal body P-ring formation protein FlgA [Candidatus Kapabacteria bacterium]HOV91834.1 flagellar basal body P-ring formation chaperone FlgA [Candidatus Kapabacteria bacterium]
MKLSIKLIIVIFIMCSIISTKLYAKSTFSADRIQQYCENYLNTNLPNVQSIEFLLKFSDIQFAEDDVNAKIEYEQNQTSSIQKLRLIFTKDEKDLKISEIPFRIYQIQKVYIAQREIHPNELISENDFAISKSETLASPDIITSTKDIDNKIAKRTIKKGEILKASSIESQKIISRGKPVQIEVISGCVKIQTTGTALDDAGIGSSVRVRRDDYDTKSVLTGEVNSEGVVQIILK